MDTLAAGLTLVSENATTNPDNFFDLTFGSNTPTFTATTMKAGAINIFQVVVQVPSNPSLFAPVVPNTATVSSSNTVPDPNLFNNSSTATSTVATSADLAINASGPLTVTAGTDVAYTVTVKNNGPSDAKNVVVSDLLPSGLIFKPTAAAQSSGPDTFTLVGNTLVATTVGAGNTDVLQFFASAPSSLANGLLLTDTASVTSDTSDPTLPNTAQVRSTVTTSADVAVKVSGPPSATEGDTVTYTVNVTNNGPSDAQNVVVSDTLSPGLTLVSANFGTSPASSSGSTITVPLGTLTAGSTVTGTIIVKATEDGNHTDSATVSTSTPDPIVSNNTAKATTAVAEGRIALAGGVNLSAAEFTALSGVTLATFTHSQAVETPASFSATISWGDGSSSSASVILSGTTYAIVGSHTYNTEGKYSILVVVSEDGASAITTSAASIKESALPAGIPQNVANSTIFATMEDSLRQPFSVGQFLPIETSLPTLLLQTAQTLIQQGQNPEFALLDIVAGSIFETIDDTFHQPLSPRQLSSIELGLLNLFVQNDQSLIQQGQDPEQALLSSFYLGQLELNLLATKLANNGAGLDSAVNEMMDSILLQAIDLTDANSNS